MSRTNKTVNVMYTEELFFYYEELLQVQINREHGSLLIKYRDPYGKSQMVSKNYNFWQRGKLKTLYDEVIQVNNMNKERERKYVKG